MPVPAAQDTEGAAVVAVLAARAAMLDRGGAGGLLEGFAAIEDPRSKRGGCGIRCPRSWGCAPRRCCPGA